jgi:N-acetylmuramic acid 6-phosphate etherase
LNSPKNNGKKRLSTELPNPLTENIDLLDTGSVLRLINREDATVASAVAKAIPEITLLVERACKVIGEGGRLVYAGAGTSGRLAMVDAAECKPTYRAGAETVIALVAGGTRALRGPVEGAEDNVRLAGLDARAVRLSGKDLLLAISASGRTPYVLELVRYAKRLGGTTAGLSSNRVGLLEAVDLPIFIDTGPEVITGSTRMKAGTACKLVLNSISTTVMIKLGRVYSNYMVDLEPVTEKTRLRAERMVQELTSADESRAVAALKASGYHVKVAIVMIRLGVTKERALKLIQQADGHLRRIPGMDS